MSLIAFSQYVPRKRGLTAALLVTLGLWAAPAEAATLVLENLTFREVTGDFRITRGERTSDALRIFQDVTGPNIDLFLSIEGLRREGLIGFRLESVVTNRTNTPWVFFDHELQEQFRMPSPEEDGLSFAQGIPSVRPRSNAFSVVDEVTDVRDFVNFTGGVVNPNQTVTFRYFILDNAPNDLFFLRQRPNFAPGGVGVVTPPPRPPRPTPPRPTPPPVAPVTSPPVAPVTPPVTPPPVAPVTPPTPPPVIDPITEPTPLTSVPEPGVLIGLLSMVGLGWGWRRLS